MAKTTDREEDTKRPTPVTRDGAYVMMLFIAFVAMVTGCVLMYLDHDEYGGKSPTDVKAPQVKALGAKAELPPAPPGPGPGPMPPDPMPPAP